MDLEFELLNALQVHSDLIKEEKRKAFLGNLTEKNNSYSCCMHHILSRGRVQALPPWSFDLSSLGCYLLLYTVSGNGKLIQNGNTYILSSESFLFLDCSDGFRLDIVANTWTYDVLFITGENLSSYYDISGNCGPHIITASPSSGIAGYMKTLTQRTISLDVISSLICSDLINRILTDVLILLSSDHHIAKKSSYQMEQLYSLLESEYSKSFSLDELANRFQMNKYRLCREFSAVYHISPLQFLNQRRIEAAKELLLFSDMKIHEVGSAVGIDNTNHFIMLFKRSMKYTPLAYRKNFLQ